jgi:hypothetical protein
MFANLKSRITCMVMIGAVALGAIAILVLGPHIEGTDFQ